MIKELFLKQKEYPQGCFLPEKDIHCHILPGVDDGFRRSEDSVEAIRRMCGYGCHEITLTPHLNPDVYPGVSEMDIRRVYEDFLRSVPEDLGVRISLAGEYMVVNDFEDRDPSTLLTYDDGSILIEMSYYFRSNNMENSIFNLSMAGLHPIIAHPERYPYMIDEMGTFEKWRDMGCRFQMNCLSIKGIYGDASVKIMKYLLDRGWYDFVATDLHSLSQFESIVGIKPVRPLEKRLENCGLFR